MKFTFFLDQRYKLKVIAHILKHYIKYNENENEKKSHRYDIIRLGHKYTKYKMYLSMMMLVCIKQHLATFEVQFRKKLSNTETELKKKRNTC